MKKRALVRLLWTVAVLALLVFLVRAFLFDVYRVDSISMEPTIHGSAEGGERVLVRYDRSRPARFELVVILREGQSVPLVKRVVGLPGESISLQGGDLIVDGRRLGPRVPRPQPIPLFGPGGDFRASFGNELGDFLDQAEGRLSYVAGTDAEPACFHPKALDGYLGPDGKLVRGVRAVADLALELELRLDPEPATWAEWTMEVTEAADRFVARWTPVDGAPDRARLRLERHGAEVETMAETQLEFARGRWHRLRLANVDDALSVEVDGRALLAVQYAGNTPLVSPTDAGYRHLLPRACFGGRDLSCSLGGLVVARDLHYVERGRFAVGEPLQLGPDEVFVLGDNSADSLDGREWGPTPLREVIGRPVAIVWPAGRLRTLSGGSWVREE